MTYATTKTYSYGFLVPAFAVYSALFLAPTIMSFFFSLTRWTLAAWNFTGLDNFIMFFSESSLNIGFRNTLVYAAVTCGLKVVLGFLLGAYLCTDIRTKGFLRSMVFFPTILSTVAVGITFGSLMHPSRGVINVGLSAWRDPTGSATRGSRSCRWPSWTYGRASASRR
jgi:raffinose/stachyose/melibiose transport system permease protein